MLSTVKTLTPLVFARTFLALALITNPALFAQDSDDASSNVSGSPDGLAEDAIAPSADADGNAQQPEPLEQDQAQDETQDEAQKESSAQFVPSEEISQDLGVSFPVDI